MGRTDDRYPAMPGGPYRFLNGRRVVESQAEDAGNSALDYGGDIRPETTKGGLPLISGYQHGIAQNGFHVTFDPPMSGVPLVVLSGGIADEPRSKWGPTGNGTESGTRTAGIPVYTELVAVNLDANGFDMRARLRQKGSRTFQSDVFTNYSGNLSAAPSEDGDYTVRYNVSAERFGSQQGSFNVEVLVDGLLVASRSYVIPVLDESGLEVFSKTWDDQRLYFTRTGLTTTSTLTLRISNNNNITSYTLSFPTVEYWTSGGGAQYASMTPDSDDFIYWKAIDVGNATLQP